MIRTMIEKIIKRDRLQGSTGIKDDLVYWLSRTPDERIAAVEYLRRQFDGNSDRLQRVARVIQRRPG